MEGHVADNRVTLRLRKHNRNHNLVRAERVTVLHSWTIFLPFKSLSVEHLTIRIYTRTYLFTLLDSLLNIKIIYLDPIIYSYKNIINDVFFLNL